MTIPDEAVQAAHAEYHKVLGDSNRSNPMLAALTAALPFLAGVKVKALEWVKPPLSETLSRCETEFGTYRTWTHDEANGKWFWSVEGGYNELTGEATDEEAAKSAAQADYEARILSAIEVDRPSPRAQALEEIISELKDAERKIFSWSGSAFVANELEGEEDADCKSELYGDLCKLGNVMSWLQTQVSALSSQPLADGWLPIDDTAMSGRIVRIAYNRDDVTMADAFYRDGKWHAACVFYRHGVGNPPYEFREHKVLESLVFAYRPLPASPGASEEPFPKPSRKDSGEPCGECHLQIGETCDICGATRPTGGRNHGE